MKKVILFVNGQFGLRVVEYVNQQPDFVILGLVLNSPKKRSSNIFSELLLRYPTIRIFEYSKKLWEETQFENAIKESELAVSALFGHRIPISVIEHFGLNIVNLHPSLLPIGRGSDPIAWALLEKQKQGVTIHVVEPSLDSGPIIAQSEIVTTFDLTAGEIYELALEELFRLFEEFIQKWPAGIKHVPQGGPVSYHSKTELDLLRRRLASGSAEVEQSLRVIQALTFSDGRTAQLRLTNGELWAISLSMARVEE